MAEMLAECLAPAGPGTPMKMFIVRVAHVHFSLVEMELTSHDTFIMSEGSLLWSVISRIPQHWDPLSDSRARPGQARQGESLTRKDIMGFERDNGGGAVW